MFGTVYGMIGAFNLLGQGTSGPRYEMLAEAISMALVTTFWGLLVAIPALFLYGFFQTRIEAFISEAAIETEAVLGRILKNGDIPMLATIEPASSRRLKPKRQNLSRRVLFFAENKNGCKTKPLQGRLIKRKAGYSAGQSAAAVTNGGIRSRLMQLNWNKRRSFEAESFDMTPIIDVVFLLIIFLYAGLPVYCCRTISG